MTADDPLSPQEGLLTIPAWAVVNVVPEPEIAGDTAPTVVEVPVAAPIAVPVTEGSVVPRQDRELLEGLSEAFRNLADALRRDLPAWQAVVADMNSALSRLEQARPTGEAAVAAAPGNVEPEPVLLPPEANLPPSAPAMTYADAAPDTSDEEVALGELPPQEEAEKTLLGTAATRTMLNIALPPEGTAAEPAPTPATEAPPEETSPRNEAYLADKYFEKGESYRVRKDLRRALGCFSEALRRNPRHVRALLERGQLYRTVRQFERAIVDFNLALEIETQNAEAYLRRGNALHGQGRIDEAIDDYTHAIYLAPQNPVAYTNRALAYAIKKETVKVIEDVTAALALDPKLSSAYFVRGAAYSSDGQHQVALTDLDRAAELDPKNPLIYNERGLVHARLQDYSQAIMNYGKALRLAPKLHIARFNRALAHHLRGDNAQAIAELTEFMRLQPKSAAGFYQRGVAYRAQNNLRSALKDFESALEMNPDYEEAEKARVEADQALRRQAEKAEARQRLEEAPEPTPEPEPAPRQPEPARPAAAKKTMVASSKATTAAAPAAEPEPATPAPAPPPKPAAPIPVRPSATPKKKGKTSTDEPPFWKRKPVYISAAALFLVVAVFVGISGGGDEREEYAEVNESIPLVKMEAGEFMKRFSESPTETEAKYKNEVVEVYGIIQDIKADEKAPTVMLKETKGGEVLECRVADAATGREGLEKAKAGSPVTIKGICAGITDGRVRLIGCRVYAGQAPPKKKKR